MVAPISQGNVDYDYVSKSNFWYFAKTSSHRKEINLLLTLDLAS